LQISRKDGCCISILVGGLVNFPKSGEMVSIMVLEQSTKSFKVQTSLFDCRVDDEFGEMGICSRSIEYDCQ